MGDLEFDEGVNKGFGGFGEEVKWWRIYGRKIDEADLGIGFSECFGVGINRGGGGGFHGKNSDGNPIIAAD